ncbi:MAG: ketopantoate reductase family protein [Thermomicrobiales bacterium]
MQTVVVGAGAMGSLLAGRMVAAGEPVTLLGRPSPHLDAIRTHGLTVEELDGSHQNVKIPLAVEPDVARTADLIVVLVKTYATTDAIGSLKAHLSNAAVVLTLQNGLGNASALRAILNPSGRGAREILTGVTTEAAFREKPGVIIHAGRGQTVIGREGGGASPRTGKVVGHLTKSGWPSKAVVDIDRWIWRKLAINAAINPLTALTGRTNAAIADDPYLWSAAKGLAGEAAAVAAARGHDLGDIARAVADVARATGENRSSMLADLDLGIRTEIDAINGAVVQEGRRLGVSVAANQLALSLVSLREQEIAEAAHDRSPRT